LEKTKEKVKDITERLTKASGPEDVLMHFELIVAARQWDRELLPI